MKTCANSLPSDCEQTELFPTASLAGSHAKTFRSLEKALDLPVSAAGYGESMPALLARYDHLTSSWKTSQLCLDGELAEFSETWPRSGMMRSGIAYQLPPLAPLTEGTAFGSFPTPNTVGWRSDGELAILARVATDHGEYRALSHKACQSKRERYWPTPRANDAEKRGDFDMMNPRNGLPAAVKRFPTPTRSMHKGSSKGAMTRLSGASRLNDRLDYAVEQGNIKTGRLNPLWVAWLMGFPIKWASFALTETP